VDCGNSFLETYILHSAKQEGIKEKGKRVEGRAELYQSFLMKRERKVLSRSEPSHAREGGFQRIVKGKEIEEFWGSTGKRYHVFGIGDFQAYSSNSEGRALESLHDVLYQEKRRKKTPSPHKKKERKKKEMTNLTLGGKSP